MALLALIVGVLGLQCNLGGKCKAEKLCLSWKKFVCRRKKSCIFGSRSFVQCVPVFI